MRPPLGEGARDEMSWHCQFCQQAAEYRCGVSGLIFCSEPHRLQYREKWPDRFALGNRDGTVVVVPSGVLNEEVSLSAALGEEGSVLYNNLADNDEALRALLAKRMETIQNVQRSVAAAQTAWIRLNTVGKRARGVLMARWHDIDELRLQVLGRALDAASGTMTVESVPVARPPVTVDPAPVAQPPAGALKLTVDGRALDYNYTNHYDVTQELDGPIEETATYVAMGFKILTRQEPEPEMAANAWVPFLARISGRRVALRGDVILVAVGPDGETVGDLSEARRAEFARQAEVYK